MNRPVLLAIALCLVLPAGASADDKLKDTLLARETEVVEAIKQKDPQKLKGLIAAQEYIVEPSGRTANPQHVKILETMQVTSYSITEAQAVSVSKDAAILSYKFVWSGTLNGKPVKDATSYATSVWALRDGKWVSVFYQETPVGK